MRGSILKRKNGYTIVYDAGRKWVPETGALIRNQKWEKVQENTKKAAEKLLARRLHEVQEGSYVEPTKITFGEFKDIWMEKYAEGEGSIRLSTLALYRGLFRNHLLPAFGGVELQRIRQEDVQAFKARLLRSGKKVKKGGEQEVGLSPQTVKHALRLFRQMLEHAIEWGYLRMNPAKRVRNPKIPKKEMDALSPDEVSVFLSNCKPKWYPFFLTAIVGGFRIGEMIAMKWGNLDWELGQYFVKETWLRPREGRKASVGVPKTESSIAPVDLTPICLDALCDHKRRQLEERLSSGALYQDQDLIFATDKGKHLDDRHVSQRNFEPVLAVAGLRRIRLHDLRHTTASLLIAQGENPKYIQKQMRHSSVQITFDRYGHLFPETNKAAGERLDQVLFGSDGIEGARRAF
jgi:integrase